MKAVIHQLSHGQRSLADYSSWGHKETQLSTRTHTHANKKLIVKN